MSLGDAWSLQTGLGRDAGPGTVSLAMSILRLMSLVRTVWDILALCLVFTIVTTSLVYGTLGRYK